MIQFSQQLIQRFVAKIMERKANLRCKTEIEGELRALITVFISVRFLGGGTSMPASDSVISDSIPENHSHTANQASVVSRGTESHHPFFITAATSTAVTRRR